VRALEGSGESRPGVGTVNLASALEGLGQKLFYPPSVAGWNGGQAWLNGQSFLLRQNLALALTSATDNRFGRRCDPAPLVRADAPGPPRAPRPACRFFLAPLPAGRRPRRHSRALDRLRDGGSPTKLSRVLDSRRRRRPAHPRSLPLDFMPAGVSISVAGLTP